MPPAAQSVLSPGSSCRCAASVAAGSAVLCNFDGASVPAKRTEDGEYECIVPAIEFRDSEGERQVEVRVFQANAPEVPLLTKTVVVVRRRSTSQRPPTDCPSPSAKKAREPGAAEARRKALMPFVIMSLSYLLFTITDGALRMIVLLHAYNKGFSAWQVAVMFTLYEAAGVVTNLLAGIAGANWGIKSTLLTGLTLQLAGIGLLFGWHDGWPKRTAILYVTIAQMLSGVAKDLTKLGGKTVTKLVTPEEKQGRLFKLVSLITGWKNSLKGLGYFLGSAFLLWSYTAALVFLEILILIAIPWAALGLSRDLGRTRKDNLRLSSIFRKNPRVNWLSLARAFLFMSRDLWFEVPLPFFFRDRLVGLGWPRQAVGAFLAGWIVLYGQVQSWSPHLILQPLRQFPANKHHAMLWALLLVACPLFAGSFLQWSGIFHDRQIPAMVAVLAASLVLFALIFAVNSAIHSYLIVKYSDGDKVAMNVGFYYMANAVGRFTGTLVSGALYSSVGDGPVDGFAACFWAASVASVLAGVLVRFVPGDDDGGLYCGALPLVKGEEEGGKVAEGAADGADS